MLPRGRIFCFRLQKMPKHFPDTRWKVEGISGGQQQEQRQRWNDSSLHCGGSYRWPDTGLSIRQNDLTRSSPPRR